MVAIVLSDVFCIHDTEEVKYLISYVKGNIGVFISNT